MTHVNNNIPNITTKSSSDTNKILCNNKNNKNLVNYLTRKNIHDDIFLRLEFASTLNVVKPIKISSQSTPVLIMTQQYTNSNISTYLCISKEKIHLKNKREFSFTTSSPLLLQEYQTSGLIFSNTTTDFNQRDNDCLNQGDLQCARVGLKQYLNTLRVNNNNNGISIDGYSATTPKIMSENIALLEEIRKDVVRTHPDLQFFFGR